MAWDDEAGAWPGGTLPTGLFTANFTTTGSFVSGTTAIRFSGRTTALDYDFASSPVVVEGVPGVDTVPPVITLLGGDVTLIQGRAFADAGARASDSRDGNISSRIITSGAVNTNVPGTYVLTYDVTDLAGNAAASVTRTVRILPPDVTRPVITAPADVIVEATSAGGVLASSLATSATANDDRYGPLPVTNNAPATQFPLGDTVIEFSAIDGEGNEGIATTTVSVIDSTGPRFSGVENVSVEAESAAGTAGTNALIVAALAAVTANDIVDGAVEVFNDAPTQFPLGDTLVRLQAFDQRENAAVPEATLTVTVVDTTAATINVDAVEPVEALAANGTPSTDATIAAFLASATAADLVDSELTVTNNAPAVFPLGITPVTFRVVDSARNETSVTRQVTVRDATKPVVTPPANITVVETGGGVISSSAAALEAFLNGASATDAVDPEPFLETDVPASLPVGETTVTFTATDFAENSGTATATITVLAAGTGDQDGDGMSDVFEVSNALNPNDPGDAGSDPDFDGFTNLQEFQNGTNPQVDSTIPVVTAPPTLTINAIGPLTPVTVTAGTATDRVQDDTLTVTVVAPRAGPLPPGRYVFIHRATDPAGNIGTAEQVVNVVPLIELAPSQSVSEGQMVLVDVLLNGDASAYPVTVAFTVTGTASAPGDLVGPDHNLESGTVTIESGRRGQIVFQALADELSEAAETVVLTLSLPNNATLGPVTTSTVTILSPSNAAPVLDIAVAQGDTAGQRVLTTGGPVTATALVSDGNVGDTFTFDWSASDPAIPASNGTTSSSYTFNPNVTPGLYRLSLRVTDAAGAATTQTILVEVLSAAPTLSPTLDTDLDGVTDALDGFGDSDGDGVPNFQDPINGGELLSANGAAPGFLLEVEPGLDLVQGQTAFAADATGAQIAIADIRSHGGTNGGTATANDTAFAYDLGFYDFVIEGVTRGASVSVVVPQSAALPAGTLVYRKFTTAGGFTSFVVNAGNVVRSAPGQLGVCPAVGSAAYVTGLTQGHFCVQLTIQDGGPNDADGAANGRVVDPGAIGRQLPVAPPPEPPPPAPRSGGGGGGCTVGDGAADPTLPLLALGALVYIARRRGMPRGV